MSARKISHAARGSALGLALLAACVATGTLARAASTGNSGRVVQTRVRKAAAPKPIEWDKITAEATDLLSKYIKINTSNPPGHEIEAARMLKGKFLSAGIPATVWQPAPGRGIVAARLHGIGRKGSALILLSHMDVVPAVAKQWHVPPFSGKVEKGYVWGRGAIDDKGPGVIAAMAMLAIKRAGILLHRDVLFIATGDEEAGGKQGAQWFTEHESNIFSDARYLLNEGGGILRLPGGKRLYEVSVTEKTPLWVRLLASGPAGHTSDPPPETAVTHLVRALARLIDYRTRIHVMKRVAEEYRVRAELGRGPHGWLDLAASLRDPAFARKFLAVPEQNAKVRDTIVPTVLSASMVTNAIPATAYADVDCRLLPGEDPMNFVRTLDKVINDRSIKTLVLLDFASTASPTKSALMSAIETLAHRTDKATVVPIMIAGFTDSRYFRRHKIVSYGFVPLELTPAEAHGVHGVDERIGIEQMGGAIRRMVELLEIFGGVQP
jgi:acetylornithine deacetylase/succinyl-diaminopimelate desuccinylase-like protein